MSLNCKSPTVVPILTSGSATAAPAQRSIVTIAADRYIGSSFAVASQCTDPACRPTVDGCQKAAEDRGQRTEDGGQRTEDRGQRTEDRDGVSLQGCTNTLHRGCRCNASNLIARSCPLSSVHFPLSSVL